MSTKSREGHTLVTALHSIPQAKREELVCYIESSPFVPIGSRLPLLAKINRSDYKKFSDWGHWLRRAGFTSVGATCIISKLVDVPQELYLKFLSEQILDLIKNTTSNWSTPKSYQPVQRMNCMKLLCWLDAPSALSQQRRLSLMAILVSRSSDELDAFVNFAWEFFDKFTSNNISHDYKGSIRAQIIMLLNKVKCEDREEFIGKSSCLSTFRASLDTLPFQLYREGELPEHQHYWVQLFEGLGYLLYQTNLYLDPRAPRDDVAEIRREAVVAMSVEEYYEFANLCQPLKNYTSNPAQINFRKDAIRSLLEIPQQERHVHLQAILLAHNPPYQQTVAIDDDRENVMWSPWIERVDKAIVWLKNHFRQCNTTEQFAKLTAFVNQLQQCPPAMYRPLTRIRGCTQATELANAKRILVEQANVGEDAMVLGGLVWHAIACYQSLNHHQDLLATANDQQRMRYSLVSNLAQCIEDNGYQVCGVGIRHRLVIVLQGYYPEIIIDNGDVSPQKLAMLLFTERFSQEIRQGNPNFTEVALQDFYSKALQQGRQRYCNNNLNFTSFKSELDKFYELQSWQHLITAQQAA